MVLSPGHPGVIAFREDSDETPTDIHGDTTAKAMYVALKVWNPETLAWERMRQPQIAPLADSLPLDTRMEWGVAPNASGELTYKGIHATHKAATSDTSWLIWKYTWTSANVTRIEGPLEGSWDGRAALAWA